MKNMRSSFFFVGETIKDFTALLYLNLHLQQIKYHKKSQELQSSWKDGVNLAWKPSQKCTISVLKAVGYILFYIFTWAYCCRGDKNCIKVNWSKMTKHLSLKDYCIWKYFWPDQVTGLPFMQQKKICFLRIGKMSFISNEIFYDITFNISYSIISS